MLALLVIGLLMFAMMATLRGVRTRRMYPVAVGSVSMLAGSAVITLLSL
jgi:hypothetical protein